MLYFIASGIINFFKISKTHTLPLDDSTFDLCCDF